MKNVVLHTLKLRNFKGIKDFTLKINGNDAKVFGDNGVGKTTLFDAFLYLLFDKDSQNKKDFALKTLDDNGKELHHLEHEVEGDFRINGSPLNLRKVYRETWTQKRGAISKEFTGHTTDYFIDGVPAKKKQFTEKVESIVKEEVFKLLTSPTFFNEQVKWQDRRATLLEICGDISEEDVLAFNSDLDKLPAILKGRKIDDHRKVIASRRSAINAELEQIPVRIDELMKSIPELDADPEELKRQVDAIESEIDENMTLANNIRNGNAILEKQQQLQQANIALEDIKRDFESDSRERVYQLKTRLQEENSNRLILNRQAENLHNIIQNNLNHAASIEKQLEGIREEWRRENAKEFSHETDCVCPSCGQDLPEDQVNEAREKALAQFNLQKANILESINKRGKDGKAKKEKLLAENLKHEAEMAKLQSQTDEKDKLIAKLNNELETLTASIKDVSECAEYQEKLNEKQQLEEQIRTMKEHAEESARSVEETISQLKAKRSELNAQIAQYASIDGINKRIKELEDQQKELAAEFENLEHELFLTEEFIRTKVQLLENRINAKFKYARFKLFETQINGGLQEVCETTFNGVPYGAGLNNAARINIGIDIINTLSEHYGIRAPIFIDNSEAVTKLIDSDSQLISLVVSEKDKKLRVESIPNEMKEAI